MGGLEKINDAGTAWVILDPEFKEGMDAFESLPYQKQMMLIRMAIRMAKDEEEKKNKLAQLHVVK